MSQPHVTLSGGTESVTKSLEDYWAAWKAFIVVHHLDVLESLAVATTLSWKVANKAALYANLDTLGASVEQLHVATVNNRFIASAVLHERYQGLSIIKILERRLGSTDRLGLDSIDFLVKDPEQIYNLLTKAGAHIEKQHNDMHSWLSLRFGKDLEFEAKFSNHLVLHVSIEELEVAQKHLHKIYAPA